MTRTGDDVLPADRGRPLGLASRPWLVGGNARAMSQTAARRRPAVGSLLALPDGDLTLALIGGQRLLRDATASLLTHEDGLRVLRAFESVAHYRAAGMETPPAILLLDCDENESAGWHGTIGELCSLCPARSVVLLVAALREEVVRCAIEHGVGGVILKSYTAKQIREAVADGDRNVLKAKTHRLAGASLSLGATVLGALCRELEAAAPQAPEAEINRLLDSVYDAFGAAREEIVRFMTVSA